MATYLSSVVLERLAAAQEVIDEYLVSCATCGTSRPCVKRREAGAVFLRYGLLPAGNLGSAVWANEQTEQARLRLAVALNWFKKGMRIRACGMDLCSEG